MKVLRLLYSQYKYCFNELADPRTSNLPLMGDPIILFIIFTIYLKFCTHWGPELMKNRNPFDIKKLLIIYNAIQVLCSASILITSMWFAYIKGGYNFICEGVHTSNSSTALTVTRILYFYFLVKVVDLLDTVFFVLKKKWAHISFLHLYHHAGMIMCVWAGIKFLPGGSSVLIAMTNSAVHTVMYAYYLLTTIRNDGGTLWWKKHITQMQIIQFLIFGVCFFSAIFHPSCGYPKLAAIVLFIQDMFFLTMFLDFYYRAYIKKSPGKLNTS